MTVRLLLADDHAMMREGLRLILQHHGKVQIVGEAPDGRAAVDLAHRLMPDVVVMDIAMPGLNGMEATRQLLADNPAVRVVALSTHANRQHVLGMLSAGAAAFVVKSAAGEELLRAIDAVMSGRKYLSAEITDVVVESSLGGGPPAPLGVAALGAREREVLQLLAEGHSGPQIAALLHISSKTVEAHRRNLMGKLNLHSVAALTKFAVREGLTSLEP